MEVLIRATEEVAPKICDSLSSIEEKLREAEPHTIVVREANDRTQWRVAGEVIATVQIDVSETVILIENHHQTVDCTLTVDDKRRFAGNINDLYSELCRVLQEAVESAELIGTMFDEVKEVHIEMVDGKPRVTSALQNENAKARWKKQ